MQYENLVRIDKIRMYSLQIQIETKNDEKAMSISNEIGY